MNDKIINISSKALMLVIIVIGIVFSAIIMSYGNPKGYKEKDIYQLGKEVALQKELDKTATQQELDAFIEETGAKIKNEMMEEQDGHVFNVINFTVYVIGLALLLIIVALAIGLIGNPKKSIKGIAGAVGLGLLIFIIYSSSSDTLFDYMIEKNAELAKDNREPIYDAVGMKLAGGSIVTSLILIGLAIIAWVGSAFYKMVKS